MVDVITYAFSCSLEAYRFSQECGANHLTAQSIPSRAESGWTVRVLIPTKFCRERADKCAKGAEVVNYQFQALPSAIGGIDYRHF